jgi:hypothetical protein
VKTNIHYLVVLDGIYTISLLRLNNTTIWNPLIYKKKTKTTAGYNRVLYTPFSAE